MIFLKRIETYGFKSFASQTVLNFNYYITGIVGPNGSGKSNINDAIMWALGEQSYKTLRGDSMEEIVFSGSDEKKALNMAEVTLVFDNHSKSFSLLDYNEVSITRKYFKTTRESEYYINNARVRLKDIQDIALETGLTKSSLAIISQGSISNFVESSSEQRRRLFDEAAGTARYKKRKEESLRKLLRSQENLDRINDIINEIERKLPSLKRQASKAKEYQAKFEELKLIEITILIKDIQLYKNKIEQLNNEKVDIKANISSIERSVNSKINERNLILSTTHNHDKELNNLNIEYKKIIDTLAQLKISKINLEGKKTKIEIDDKEFKISDLKTKAKELEIRLATEEQMLASFLLEKNDKKINLDKFSKERFILNTQLDEIRKELAKIESNLEVMSAQKNNYDNLFEGVRNVLENKEVLPGVIGTVQELISVEKEFEIAISIALQSSFQNLVMNSAKDAKSAINFLKQNKAGVATFLPLDTIKPNYIKNDMRFALQNAKGFLDFANNIVKIDNKYQIILDYLLATNIIVKSYDEALEISKMTQYKYHVITLEGERIAPFGAISGGSRRVKNNLFNEKNKIIELQNKKNQLDSQEVKITSEINLLNEKIELFREQNLETQSTIGTKKQVIELIEKEITEIKEEYRILTGRELNDEDQVFKSVDEQIIKIIQQISESEAKRDTIEQQMNVLRSIKDSSSEKQTKLNLSIDENQKILQALREKYSNLNTDVTLINEKKISSSNRLAQEYNLTFEAASELDQINIDNEEKTREQINILRNEIKFLGNINIDSIDEYQEENSRYETYVQQSNDIIASINSIKDAIKKMDDEMVIQFKKIINKVNLELPKTFAALFGAGTASITYTNPDDILNSGIDIKISPPGKKITNLNLLSGGEKSMVALSVLFSILRVKPIPLVILDEVEAPLDISNVIRFAKYIKSFTNNTQFIIVTHRIGTMENCDVLFGATMQQKGITKLVQVKLLEAKKMIKSN